MESAESGHSAQPDSLEQAAYEALQSYTLTHGGPAFIHQHVVDAWTAQHANERTKPIALTFALAGLFLHLERGCTGRQVQLAHMAMARHHRDWPTFTLPKERGGCGALQVMAHPPGPERDRAIDDWCASVWSAYHVSHRAVAEWIERLGIV